MTATQLSSFLAVAINDRTKEMQSQGIDVVRFSVGEPDFKSPKVVKEACIKAIQRDQTRYEHSQGSITLRRAIVHHYKKKYGVQIHEDQVLVTPGTSAALFLAFSVLIGKGDEVILPNPHYPPDRNYVKFAGGTVRLHKLKEAEGFHWNFKRLQKQINKKTKAFLVTSPSNPTGALMSAETYQSLANTGITIVSDEIYHGLSYENKEHTALEFTSNCFVVSGFSKAFAMTGYRLGFVIAPKDYVEKMRSFQQNFYISVNSFVQAAGVAALEKANSDVDRMRKSYHRRRNILVKGLQDLGFPIQNYPEGAFYVLANCQHIDPDSRRLSVNLLEKAKVAVSPGVDFGSAAEGYLRFSFALKESRIKEGLKRLEKYLG